MACARMLLPTGLLDVSVVLHIRWRGHNPGEHAEPGRNADGIRSVGLFETHAPSREPVHIWCFYPGIPRATHHPGVLLVRYDQQYVRSGDLRVLFCSQNQAGCHKNRENAAPLSFIRHTSLIRTHAGHVIDVYDLRIKSIQHQRHGKQTCNHTFACSRKSGSDGNLAVDGVGKD